MMRVRWTTNAADDLARIVERIREDNPAAAQRVAKKIYTAVAELRKFPHRGRVGLADYTRELVFPVRRVPGAAGATITPRRIGLALAGMRPPHPPLGSLTTCLFAFYSPFGFVRPFAPSTTIHNFDAKIRTGPWPHFY